MTKQKVLITGANGEVGHGLIEYLAADGNYQIIALDLHPLNRDLENACSDVYVGDIRDQSLLEAISAKHNFKKVFHLAGLLSTGAEKSPLDAHAINVQGSLRLLEICRKQSLQTESPPIFLFPSTIAVYGIASLQEKNLAGAITEEQFLSPITMYGMNKLYVESLGSYFRDRFNLLADEYKGRVDFRALRYPGIISSETLPTSGTSDYFPEMLHAAAQGKKCTCFVRPDTRLPYFTIPDAIKALAMLSDAPPQRLRNTAYNVTSFTISAEEIRNQIQKAFPRALILFDADKKRQQIVDSWPADIDDNAARNDWNWKPDYNLERAFAEYLIPGVVARYASKRQLSSSKKKCING